MYDILCGVYIFTKIIRLQKINFEKKVKINQFSRSGYTTLVLNRTKSFTKGSIGHLGVSILTKGLLTELPLVKVSILEA